MSSRRARLCGAFLMWSLTLTATGGALADTIMLKTATRQRDGRNAILLSDIATLEGLEAQRLADVEVAAIDVGRHSPMEISVAEVRRSLDAAGANWARVHLSGRSVIVRPARSAESLPPQAMASASIDTNQPPAAPQEAAIVLDEWMSRETVAGAIARLMVANLRIEPQRLRVTVRDSDLALLELTFEQGRFEIQPLGSLAADRVVAEVRRWNGASVEPLGQIALGVERLTDVPVARHDMVRGSVITEADFESNTTWLTASESMQIADRPAIVGGTATRSMKAGESIRGRDVAREHVIERGDLVIVRCLVGGVAISMQAEARERGGVGDVIEFRKTGERDSFLARIAARGQAVVDLSRR